MTTKATNIIEISKRGDWKVGEQLKIAGEVYKVVEILGQSEHYELDGITYDEYPGEEPDQEWWETRFRAQLVNPKVVSERQEKARLREEQRAAEYEANRQEIADKQTKREAEFQAFLDGEDVQEIWSGYDLPAAVYDQSSPINQSPELYRAEHVGNGLGYHCKNSGALTDLYQYIFDNYTGDAYSAQQQKNALIPYETNRNGTPLYTAGAQYYRWAQRQKVC